MKLPTLLLLVLGAANVAAYSTSGAYERMLYWYAYQLDQQGDGPKTIAKNCAKEENRGNPCNLKQFLTYIAADGEKPHARALPEAINAHNIKADTAAEIIFNGHVTGQYTAHHVVEKLEEVSDLFKAVSRYGLHCPLGAQARLMESKIDRPKDCRSECVRLSAE